VATSLTKLLAEVDDFKLCNGLSTRIIEWHGDDFDVSILNPAERAVLLTWHVSGIVGNGGFRYLFEGNIPGDPYFELTAEPFRTIGCKAAADAVAKTLAIFPNSRPTTNIVERLPYYLKRVKGWPTKTDLEFMDANDSMTTAVANYIRSHAADFAHLDGARPKPARKKTPKPSKPARDESKSGPTLGDLPHWARVAFAARCALRVLPLYERCWPGAPKKHSKSLLQAVDLAERSAAEGCPLEDLKDAHLNALIAAGAAFRAGSEIDRSSPPDAYSGSLASNVAKAVEKAAESAMETGDKSLDAAMEACSYSAGVAKEANENRIVEELSQSFGKLLRAAARGKWTDRTTIPADIWSML
jgi:Domain of unknown function (DUF4375)